LAFLSSLDATARSFRGAAPILHRADHNDLENRQKINSKMFAMTGSHAETGRLGWGG
jgi:hypothetical protein